MNRRGLLGLLGGAAVAGPSAAKKALAELSTGPVAAQSLQNGLGVQVPTFSDRARWRARQELNRMAQSHALERRTNEMSYRIAGKRSWSAAFKASEHVREMREWLELERRLENDGMAEKFLRALGVDLEGLE